MHLMFFACQILSGHLWLSEIGRRPAAATAWSSSPTTDKRSQELYDKLFPGVSPIGFVSLRSNVTSAHYWSIAKGAGIGMLPTYAQAIGAQLVPLDIGVVHPIDIWMTYHPDAKRIARVKRTIDWIVQSFDPQRFPWFRDEFIHPEKLSEILQGRTAGEFCSPAIWESKRRAVETPCPSYPAMADIPGPSKSLQLRVRVGGDFLRPRFGNAG